MRKRRSIDELIAELDEKISKAQARVKDLRAKRSELLEMKESVAMQEIYGILREKGMSASQAAEILRSN